VVAVPRNEATCSQRRGPVSSPSHPAVPFSCPSLCLLPYLASTLITLFCTPPLQTKPNDLRSICICINICINIYLLKQYCRGSILYLATSLHCIELHLETRARTRRTNAKFFDHGIIAPMQNSTRESYQLLTYFSLWLSLFADAVPRNNYFR
jgi:hypothetical protein